MANLLGITSVSNPDNVEFTAVSDSFLRKHGRKRCPCCKEEGADRIVEIAPAINGATRIKAAVCRDHEEEGRKILREEWTSFRSDDSWAEYSLPSFGR